MKKIMIMLLVFITGSVSGYFVKDYVDLHYRNLTVNDVTLKDSKSCVGLSNEETFSCLTEVASSEFVAGNDLFILGQLYLYGLGTEVNSEKAVRELERSAFEFDNVDAMVLLGNLFIDTDRLAGKYWYSQATQRGSLEGQLRLANIYRYSEEDQNPALAFSLYQSAANQGVASAQYELALIYAMGVGIDPNIDRAVQILEIPCSNGHEDSCVLLNRIKELKAESNRS